jgi:hypothetical protein
MKAIIERDGKIYVVYKYKNKTWVYDITQEELGVLLNQS